MEGPVARTQPEQIRSRHFFSEEFKQEAVQMLLDGHSAPSVAERLGLPGPNVMYRWKRETMPRNASGGRYSSGAQSVSAFAMPQLIV